MLTFRHNLFLTSALIFLSSLELARAAEFETLFVDIDGIQWGQKLRGTYTNGCTNAAGSYDENNCQGSIAPENSPAAKACDDIGARLPTSDEYKQLIRSFDHTEDSRGPEVSQLGKEQMQATFGGTMKFVFHTSTLSYPNTPRDNYYSQVFGASEGGFGDVNYGSVYTSTRLYKLPVRCVR